MNRTSMYRRARAAVFVGAGLVAAATFSACSDSKNASGSASQPSGSTQGGSADAPSGTKSPADGSGPARSGS